MIVWVIRDIQTNSALYEHNCQSEAQLQNLISRCIFTCFSYGAAVYVCDLSKAGSLQCVIVIGKG